MDQPISDFRDQKMSKILNAQIVTIRRAPFTKAMRNCFFYAITSYAEFRMTEINRKKMGIPETRNYAEILNGTNGTVLLLRKLRKEPELPENTGYICDVRPSKPPWPNTNNLKMHSKPS